MLIGYVEPHGRPETEALLLGLDILPDRLVEYRGIKLREFDLDAALKAVKAWPTAERLLVAVGPSPTSAAVIRAAKRLAISLRAEWIAASVETPHTADMSEKSRQQFLRNLKLAEQLGAETVTLSGERVADEILACAAARHVTKIVVGKTNEPWWLFRGSLVNKVIRRSGDVDVYVIRGVEEPFEGPAPVVRKPRQLGGCCSTRCSRSPR